MERFYNLAIVGHGDVGKTSLVSGLLFASKASNRLGSVEDGTAQTDFMEEEFSHKVSLGTALARVEWKDSILNLLDTPGYGNFQPEARGAIHLADAGLVVVSAQHGVEVMATKAWRMLSDCHLPKVVVLNQMDRENVSFDQAVKSVTETWGRDCVPIQLPLGEGSDFSGVIDLLTFKAHRYKDDGSGSVEVSDPSGPEAQQAQNARAELMERVAESNEELMDIYLEKGSLEPDQISKGLRAAVVAGDFVPIICTVATAVMGLDLLMDTVLACLPSAVEHAPWGFGEEEEFQGGAEAPLTLQVIKTFSDPFAGRVSAFRVLGGELHTSDVLYNTTTKTDERLGGLFHFQGKDHLKIDHLVCGDIGGTLKLKDSHTGETLVAKGADPIVLAPPKFPSPSISFAVHPKSKGDDDKLMGSLLKMVEEDPTLKVGRDPQTHEVLFSGNGVQHVEVAAERVKNRYGVDLELSPPKIPYRETIKGKADVHSRHKKQSGGHGQFADISIRVEPLPSGSGVVFEEEIFANRRKYRKSDVFE